MKKKFDSENYQSPTWFFFNKLFNARIKKFKSFGVYKKLNIKKKHIQLIIYQILLLLKILSKKMIVNQV